MPFLIGGQSGNSSRLSSGLLAGSAMMVSLVLPLPCPTRLPSPGPTAGKFRRAILGVTKDNAGAPTGSVQVKAIRTSDDVKVDSGISDASGNYELSVYEDGPFYVVAPGVSAAGITASNLTGV